MFKGIRTYFTSSSPSTHPISSLPVCEELEVRRLMTGGFSTFATLALDPQLRVINDVSSDQFADDRATFSLSSPGEVSVRLFNLGKRSLFGPDPAVEGRIVRIDGSGVVLETLASKVFTNGSQFPLITQLGAGDYAFDLIEQANTNLGTFSFLAVADTVKSFQTADGFRESLGRRIPLQTGSSTFGREFIGLTNPAGPSFDVDLYTFDVVRSGTVHFDISAFGNSTMQDVFGLGGQGRVRVFRDVNSNGVYETSEEIRSLNTESNLAFNVDVTPGHYAFLMDRLEFLAAVNYDFKLSHVVPELPGNSLATAHNLGTVGAASVSFTDYLDNGDTTDFYRFDTLSGGPFTFSALLKDMDVDRDFDLALIRDFNNNGVVDSGDVLGSSSRVGGLDESIDAAAEIPGTYFLRVLRKAGLGTYTLSISAPSGDTGGSTLGTATNIGNLLGRKDLAGLVSVNDTIDFYKFTLTRSATLPTQLVSQTGGLADLALVRDANSNLVIDSGDVIASATSTSTTNAAFQVALSAGTYYLRVRTISGKSNYVVSLNSDTAGNVLGQASTLIPAANTTVDDSRVEFVGGTDATDAYKMTLSQFQRLGIFLSLLDDTVRLKFGADGNNNGVLDAGEQLINVTSVGSSLAQFVNLAPGTYFLTVENASTSGTNYGLTVLSTGLDLAGNSPQAARDIGTQGAQQSFSDQLIDAVVPAMDDFDDYYRFSLGNEGPYLFNATFANLTGSIGARLILDRDNNGRIDDDEVLAQVGSAAPGVLPPAIDAKLTEAGVYYLQVLGSSASYTVRLSTTSTDNAGNTTARAAILPLDATNAGLATGVLAPNDTADFYRMTVGSPGLLRADIDFVSSAVEVSILDAAGNRLASRTAGLSQPGVIDGLFLPAAGDYFVVVSSFGNTNYSVRVSTSPQSPFLAAGPVQISGTATTKIEFENFDKGGQGVAYNDATPTNDGGVTRTGESVELKSTSDSGGGFRSSTTAAGEFLEYTVNVIATGTYDLDFRVASQDPGATFHLDVDGVNVTGSIAVPDTNGFDTFTTVTKTGVFLTSGPHLLRLALDTNTTGTGRNASAGNFNFINVRPNSSSVGVVKLLTPRKPIVAGKATQLGLEWTVPGSSWNDLKEVTLRFCDGDGTRVQVKLNVNKRTLQLYNIRTHQYGHAMRLGSDGVLSNRSISIDLSKCSLLADGNSDTSVVLNLAVTFQRKLRHTELLVEAAAQNDFGQKQDFTYAGKIRVR